MLPKCEDYFHHASWLCPTEVASAPKNKSCKVTLELLKSRGYLPHNFIKNCKGNSGVRDDVVKACMVHHGMRNKCLSLKLRLQIKVSHAVIWFQNLLRMKTHLLE